MKDLPLIELRIEDNPVVLIGSYFEQVLKYLPKLYILDGMDRDGLRVEIMEEGKRPQR